MIFPDEPLHGKLGFSPVITFHVPNACSKPVFLTSATSMAAERGIEDEWEYEYSTTETEVRRPLHVCLCQSRFSTHVVVTNADTRVDFPGRP